MPLQSRASPFRRREPFHPKHPSFPSPLLLPRVARTSSSPQRPKTSACGSGRSSRPKKALETNGRQRSKPNWKMRESGSAGTWLARCCALVEEAPTAEGSSYGRVRLYLLSSSFRTYTDVPGYSHLYRTMARRGSRQDRRGRVVAQNGDATRSSPLPAAPWQLLESNAPGPHPRF